MASNAMADPTTMTEQQNNQADQQQQRRLPLQSRGQTWTSNTNKKTNQRRPLIYLPILVVLILACSIILIAVLYQVQAAATTTTTTIDMGPPDVQKSHTQVKRIETPVIGILTEVLRDYKRFTKTRHLHIAASYVKWIESAGAQVMPILLNQDDQYYERVFRQTNGLLFPGGDNLLDPAKRTPMMVAANKLYRLAVEANDRGDFYPIWGTCLGLELLSVLTTQRNVLDSCKAHDISLAMSFVPGRRGKMFAPSSYSNLAGLGADYSAVVMDILTKEKITYNYHQKCLTDEGLARANLSDFYRPLAYSEDKNGFRFITIMEAVRYPFYGVQFHPEKPPFEFVVKKSQVNIPHSREAIAVSRFFGDFFVTQAQLSGHKSEDLSPQELIYNFTPTYTAPMKDMYEQRYLFPYGNSTNNPAQEALSTEEFIDDHVVESDEEVPEDVSQPVEVWPQPAAATAHNEMLLGLVDGSGDSNNNNIKGAGGQEEYLFRRLDLKVTNEDDNNIYVILQSNGRTN